MRCVADWYRVTGASLCDVLKSVNDAGLKPSIGSRPKSELYAASDLEAHDELCGPERLEHHRTRATMPPTCHEHIPPPPDHWNEGAPPGDASPAIWLEVP